MFSLLRSISLGKGRVAVALLLSSLATSSFASKLTDIQFAELPGQKFEIKLKFDEQPDSPKGYTIEKPARVVLDFPGVESALKQKKFPVSFDAASSVVVLSSGGRTRMIVNLNELVNYNTRFDGSDVVIEMGSNNSGGDFIKSGSSMTAAISSNESQQEFARAITSLDFRRGEAGEGKIILGLSDPNVNIDANSTGGKLTLNFDGVSIPAELRRRLDVVDFATPVSFVDSSYDGGSTKVVIETSREYDYLAYQADDQYVVSVKPLTRVEREERKKQFAYVGKKLSLNFQNIEVRSVLQLIADITDLNLVASDTVGGSITLRLENVPWDQALSLVLKTKGLDKRQVGNVLMVAPAAEIAERERLELETQKQLEELAPLRTEYIRVRYANARELFKLFNQPDNGSESSNNQDGNSTGSILSERGQAIVDERTNSIILTDTEEKIEEFRKLIAQVDIPVRQVMIEARIVVANTDYRKELGVRWQAVGRHQIRSAVQRVPVLDANGNATFNGSGQQIFRTQTVNQRSGLLSGATEAFSADNFDDNGVWTPTIDQANMVDLGVTNPFGSIAMWLSSDNGSLGLELSALEDSGFAEIVSQPKVITGDKQIAYIESGKELPYQEASASGATAVSFRQAVLKLEVTPQITPDDRIIMDLLVKQDSLSGEESNIPIIDVNRLETEVLVDNGQTVVLGGIFQDQVTKGTSKVPLLGDIPYLGRLFKKDLQVRNKRELLIFITPKILAQSFTE